MKASTIAIIAAALVAVYLVFRNSTSLQAGATSRGATVAGGVPSLLNAASSPGWVTAIEGLFGGTTGAANAIQESGPNAGAVVTGGAATVQANANVAGFGSGGSTMGLTASQIAGAQQVEASDENLVSLIQSGGITTTSIPIGSTLDETEALASVSTPSYDNSMLPLSGGYDANNYSALLA